MNDDDRTTDHLTKPERVYRLYRRQRVRERERMNRFLLFLSFFLECYTESYCVYIGSFCIDSSIFSYTWGGWGGGPSQNVYVCSSSRGEKRPPEALWVLLKEPERERNE